jgi:hypothetical protein
MRDEHRIVLTTICPDAGLGAEVGASLVRLRLIGENGAGLADADTGFTLDG